MSVIRLSIFAILAFPLGLDAALTTVTSVMPLPNKQARVCWQGVRGAEAYWVEGSDAVENLFTRATGDTICRDVHLFGATEGQMHMVTVRVQKQEDGESAFGPASPHFHFMTPGTFPIDADHVGDDFLSPSPVCSPADRYPTTEASERMGPSELRLTDVTTESDSAPRVRLNLTCPIIPEGSRSLLKKFEIYESVLKTDGSTATQTISHDSCPNDFVLTSGWGDRVTITVAAIYFHTADQKLVHSVCSAPHTLTFGSALVTTPELRQTGATIEGTLGAGKAGDQVLLFNNVAEPYRLDAASRTLTPKEGRFAMPVDWKRGVNRVYAVARRTVQGHDVFSEPAELLLPQQPAANVVLTGVPEFDLMSQLYVSGTAPVASPVKIEIWRGDAIVYATTIYSSPSGEFGSDLRLPPLAAGAYRITATSPGSKQPFVAAIHLGEIEPAPAISIDAGPGPFFVSGTSATISGKVTPRLETPVAERYESPDSTTPALFTQSGSGYGMLAIVNGREIPFETDEDSTFRFVLPLQAGRNTIRLQAKTTLSNQTAPPVGLSIDSGPQVPGAIDLDAVNAAVELGWRVATSDHDAAAAAFTKVIEIDPAAPAGYAGRAAVDILRGHAKEAFEDASRAIERDARDHRAWSYRANYLLEQGKNEEVIRTTTRSIALDPTWSMPFENRASAHLNLEHFAEAAADATKAIELQEKNPYALRVRALAHHHLGRNTKALEDIRTAMDLEPDSTYGLWILAQLQAVFGDYAQAIEQYTKLIAADAAGAQPYLIARAWAHYQKGELDQALADVTKAATLKDDAYVHSARAWILFAKGDRDGAIAEVEKAKAFNAAYTGVEIDGALLDFIRGNHARAVQEWESALARDADELEIVTPLLARAREAMASASR